VITRLMFPPHPGVRLAGIYFGSKNNSSTLAQPWKLAYRWFSYSHSHISGWNILYFPIYSEQQSHLTNIFQRGWNQQPDIMIWWFSTSTLNYRRVSQQQLGKHGDYSCWLSKDSHSKHQRVNPPIFVGYPWMTIESPFTHRMVPPSYKLIYKPY